MKKILTPIFFYLSMTALKAQNTGIGTTTPLSTLHIADQTESLVLVNNKTNLGAGVNAFLDLKIGNYITGRIGSVGFDPATASLGFYTGADPLSTNLVKRLSILNNGNIGIGLADAIVTEKLHIDGNIKLGSPFWASSANDRLIKFGDANYVMIGEAESDDRMVLTASGFIFRNNDGNGNVGIGTAVAATERLEVNGSIKITDATQGTNKVLTSDNTGKGSWQLPVSTNTGFKAAVANSFTATTVMALVPFLTTGSYFGYTNYDDGGNYSNAPNYQFTAPANGVYHFDVIVSAYSISILSGGGSAHSNNVEVNLVNADPFSGNTIARNSVTVPNGYQAFLSLPLSVTLKMNAGQKIEVTFGQDTSSNFMVDAGVSMFTGYRVY